MDQITNQAIMWRLVSGVIGVVLPVVVLLLWKRKTKCSLKPAVAGAIIFFVFSQLLEGIPKFIFFTSDTSLTAYVWSHTWAYVLIGCMQAGIFEEVGRFAAFGLFLKKYREKRDAITYGIGHGGIESILILGTMGITSIGMAESINNGSIQQAFSTMSLGQQRSVELQVAALAGYSFSGMLLDVFERMLAMVLHLSLSVVVFRAVKEKRIKDLFVAILLHAIFDVPAALYQCGAVGRGLAEVLLCVLAIGIAAYARKLYIAIGQ